MKYLKSSKSETVLSIENGNEQSLALPHPSFHRTISFVITLAQFFGVMPLYGMSADDIHHIKFKWKSLRFVYTMYNFSGALISSLFCCTRFAMHGLMLDKTGGCNVNKCISKYCNWNFCVFVATVAFYICNLFATLQFVHISKNWYIIVREWSLVEMSMRSYGFLPDLKRKFKILTITIMMVALSKKHVAVFYFEIDDD